MTGSQWDFSGTKEGVCPSVQAAPEGDSRDCDDECRTDGDCRGEHKCCFNGCGKSCLLPAINAVAPPVTARPDNYQPTGTCISLLFFFCCFRT